MAPSIALKLISKYGIQGLDDLEPIWPHPLLGRSLSPIPSPHPSYPFASLP